MAHTLYSSNCYHAWADACKFILRNGNGFNLLVTIENPLLDIGTIPAFIEQDNLQTEINIHNVTNTIFPIKFYNRNSNLSIPSFKLKYSNVYKKGKFKTKNKRAWGTYFLRMIAFGPNKVDQLHRIINGISRNRKNSTSAYYIQLSNCTYDSNIKLRGNPCLQYIQVSVINNMIDLFAVYRNHDFNEKALGNYLGLAHLLNYICSKSNKSVGKIVCHSIHYNLDHKRLRYQNSNAFINF